MPFLHVTSRVRDRQDDRLHSDYGFTHTPCFAFLDPKGGVLSTKAGVLDIAGLQRLAESAAKLRAAFLDLKAKAAAGDALAQQRFEVMELELGHVTYADYRQRNPDLAKLTEGVRDSVLMVAGDVLLKDAKAALAAAGRDREKQNAALLEVGERLLAGVKEGAEPFDDQPRIRFYYYLGTAGDRHGRTDMLEAAMTALEDDAEDNKNVAQTLAAWKKKLAALKTAK